MEDEDVEKQKRARSDDVAHDGNPSERGSAVSRSVRADKQSNENQRSDDAKMKELLAFVRETQERDGPISDLATHSS